MSQQPRINITYKNGYLPGWGIREDMNHYRYSAPFNCHPNASWYLDARSSNQQLEQYMLGQLNEHVLHIDVKTEDSETHSYRTYEGMLPKPTQMYYTMKDGTSHTISFKSRVGDIDDLWAAPLSIDCVKYDGTPIAFIFHEGDDRGRSGHLNCPHVVLNDGSYVKSHGVKSDLEEHIRTLSHRYNEQLKYYEHCRDVKQWSSVPNPGPEPIVPSQDDSDEVKFKYTREYISYRGRLSEYLVAQSQLEQQEQEPPTPPEGLLEENYPSTFMQYFLEKCKTPARIRHILTHISDLSVRSGK